MKIFQSLQALEGGMLTELAIDLRKSVVTAAALLALVAGMYPLSARALDAEAGTLVQSGNGAAGMLPALLESRLAASMRGAEDATLLFYRQRGFRPAWTRQEQLYGLAEAVGGLRDHGLEPSDFALDTLRGEALQDFAEVPVERQVARELLFTDTLVRLIQQLRHGRLDPRGLYADWNFSRPARAVEQAARLGQVLEAQSLLAAVQAQAPDTALYRQLQVALKQYRLTVLLMTIYKCILEDNQENKSFTAFFKAFKSKDAKWFILNSILITIGFALVSAVIFFAIGFLSSLIITGGKISGPIVTIIGLTLAIMIYARVIIILPAAATGNRINLFEAFRLTRNYKLLTLFAVFVMPFLFVAILSAISVLLLTGLTYIIQDLSIIFFTFIFNTIYATTIAIFTNICIAILYKHIKQDSIEDTSKQVEEIETESKEINKED
jgi:hypothetical protein